MTGAPDPWCATVSLERSEDLAATASRVERWLLVEHVAAWGPASVPDARMPVAASRAVTAAARAAGARVLLLRRPAGVPDEPGRWVYAVDSRPGRERVLARHLDDDRALAALVPPYGDDVPEGWQPVVEPLLLVCTHGRHDRCCATRGRPVARALAARWPERTWECSHVGGDRFAANLLVLPDGLFVGRVEPGSVVRLVEDLDAGTLPHALVRGRSSLPSPVQAAQHFAREATGRHGAADLAPLEQTGTGTNEWRVRLGGPAGEVSVVVGWSQHGDGERAVLSCGHEPKTAPAFRLVSLSPG